MTSNLADTLVRPRGRSPGRPIGRVGVAALAGLTAATSAPTVSAGPGAARYDRGDGVPTAQACAELGYAPRDREMGRAGGISAYVRPAPGYAPPPPPALAAPAAGAALSEMVVSSGRMSAQRIAPYPAPARDTERYPGAASNPIRQTADEPVSTFSVDVDTAAYANVRRFLNEGTTPPTDAVRVEELVNYFDYGYRPPADRTNPFAAHAALAPSPWSNGAQRQILHIGIQGLDLPPQAAPPLNLVFLVDTSGSMWGEDRLPLAQKSLNLLVDQMRPQDRVAIVAYAGSAGAVLAPTDGRSKLKVRCALNALQSGGSTAGGAGLKLAYDLARQNFEPRSVNRVILVTDGDFNVGIADPNRLKDFVTDQRKSGVYLSVFGFGRGNYNDTMMQGLAQNGNGIAAYVDSLQEARRLFRTDFSRSMFPIADDVKIQVEFNPARVSEYRLIGYETRMLAREDFNNDQVDAGEVGSGASVTALYEITPAGAAGSVDPLRYGSSAPAAGPTSGPGAEIAHLKIRYKLPGERKSRLMDRPITPADGFQTLAAAPEATRWAVAVAGFGQKLRRDPRVADSFGWQDVVALAQSSRGQDPHGERAEFVQLVRAAGDRGSAGE
jgi:Ca-activated chloride channel family protein